MPDNSARTGRKRVMVKAIDPLGRPFCVSGQVAKVLLAIVEAGEAGITPLSRETWSLRLSHHIGELKKQHGIAITRMWGQHEDGRHARYVLQCTVVIVEIIKN